MIKAYAIKGPDGVITKTISEDAKNCWFKYFNREGGAYAVYEREDAEKKGYSCVPVWITEQEPDRLDAGRSTLSHGFMNCHFEGPAPKPFTDWNAWAKQPVKIGAKICSIEYAADPSTITVPRETLDEALNGPSYDGSIRARDEIRAILKVKS